MVAFETWWARCRGVSTLDTQGSPAFPASYCWLVAPVLDVPTVGTATSFTFDGEMAIKVTRCGVGVIHPPPFCRWSGLVEGHIIDWCRKWVLLTAIVTSNQPLSQANAKWLENLPWTTVVPGFEVPLENECIHCTAVEQEPKNVPAENKHFVICFQRGVKNSQAKLTYRTFCTSFSHDSTHAAGQPSPLRPWNDYNCGHSLGKKSQKHSHPLHDAWLW